MLSFGKEVAVIVNGFLNLSRLYNENNDMQSENYHKLTLTFAEDIRVIYLNLVFRLMLMRQLEIYNAYFQKRIINETSKVYIDFAHKLGFTELKNELEDLCLKYIQPDIYFDISKKLTNAEAIRDKYIEEFINPIDEKLKAFGLKYTIKGRNKTISSIYRKMINSNVSFDQIYDLTAIRIIVDTTEEKEKEVCWRIYSLVTELYPPNINRMKDWVTTPKHNGYEALHITVMGMQSHWVEVQIRSRRMDEIAEKGLASHWKYKGIRDQEQFDSLLGKLTEVLHKNTNKNVDLIESLNVDLFEEDLFVFTDNGTLHKMLYGSTVLDFAFQLNSETGYNCMSGVVNGMAVPIRYKLNNGDRVKIITASRQMLKRDWLKFVKTDHAVNLICRRLREEQNNQEHIPEPHEISLSITGKNAPENMMDIIRIISDAQDVSLDFINVNATDPMFIGHLTLSSSSMEALDEVIKELSGLEHINTVQRI